MADRIRPLLLCYDGSACAEHAIGVAGELVEDGRLATVLHVWESVVLVTAGYPLEGFPTAIQPAATELDALSAQRADELAAKGAELARHAGFAAEGRAVESEGRVWATIVRVADELDAAAVVLGSRGLSSVRSALLGSVSNGVLHHAQRPVLVVPAAD